MIAIPNQTPERISRALGEAVVRIWSHLPQDIQHRLFEEAIASQDATQGTQNRTALATFLHDKHSRTCAAIRASAIPEPDSLGG